MTLLTMRWLHRAPFQLDGMSLEMPEVGEEHLNRVPFRGILTQVDEPSTRAPNGSSGHRVMIPRAVAEAALPSLMGMPIDCSLGLKDHDKKTVVGVITGAEIQGNDLVVAGHLLAKNFPDEIAAIQLHKSQLGMSYEISNVHVEDVDATVWTLTGLQFTGAAILYKHAAAYQHTAIAARAEEDGMTVAADRILEKLNVIDSRVRGLEASKMDEDDEAAAKDEADAKEHEATAARYDAAAQQARDDKDEEDAAKQDADAAKARQEASVKRLAAAKRHEEAAAKLRAAEHQEATAKDEAEAAAVRHEAEAKRLKDMDDKCKEEAAAAQADAAATKPAVTASSTDGSMERMMAAMFKAMAETGGGSQAAATATKKTEDADPMERMFGMFLRAMTYMPGMMDGAKEHDDEDQDKKLIREFLRKGKDKDTMAAASPVVNLEERRRLRRIEAAMELLTDQVSKLAGLLTDGAAGRRGLATDAPNGVNGGPVRRSLQATTEQWIGKYDDDGGATTKRTDGKMTMPEIEAALDANGVTDPKDRIAKIVDLQMAGKVAN